jgi:thiol-disulfide isomerase/thioredoxin
MILEELKSILEVNQAVMLYFSGKNCNVCKALKPKITEAFKTNLPQIKQIFIDVELQKDIAIEYNIFSIPTILVFFENREFARKSRNLSIPMFIQELQRPYQILYSTTEIN